MGESRLCYAVSGSSPFFLIHLSRSLIHVSLFSLVPPLEVPSTEECLPFEFEDHPCIEGEDPFEFLSGQIERVTGIIRLPVSALERAQEGLKEKEPSLGDSPMRPLENVERTDLTRSLDQYLMHMILSCPFLPVEDPFDHFTSEPRSNLFAFSAFLVHIHIHIHFHFHFHFLSWVDFFSIACLKRKSRLKDTRPGKFPS